jgi:hypothetical protein
MAKHSNDKRDRTNREQGNSGGEADSSRRGGHREDNRGHDRRNEREKLGNPRKNDTGPR